MPEIIIVAHNIRSTHNVGAIFRTAEGLGIKRIILSGYSPYPRLTDDPRLPHLADKITKQINKTALGAEHMVPFVVQIEPDFHGLKTAGYYIVGLEQHPASIPLADFKAPPKLALVLGEEVHGMPETLLSQCDAFVEIPMVGQKESFNVSVATGIALYSLSLKS